jgi:hypothetical protein
MKYLAVKLGCFSFSLESSVALQGLRKALEQGQVKSVEAGMILVPTGDTLPSLSTDDASLYLVPDDYQIDQRTGKGYGSQRAHCLTPDRDRRLKSRSSLETQGPIAYDVFLGI